MEEWEIELREKLDKELSDGYYQISSGEFTIGTGKQGYIDYQVILVKHAKEFILKEEENGKGN